MSGTAAHMVRLYVSVPPSQPPSRNSLAKNSSRMAARFSVKGSVGTEKSEALEDMVARSFLPQQQQRQIILQVGTSGVRLHRGPNVFGADLQRQSSARASEFLAQARGPEGRLTVWGAGLGETVRIED